MFTGLIEHCGRVRALRTGHGMARLEVETPYVEAAGIELGESVAINGVCLTVVEWDAAGLLGFDVLEETLRCTSLGGLELGGMVNLERAMAGHARFGGHLVQGHVDGVGTVERFEAEGTDWRLRIGFDSEFSRWVVHKGSIAVDGISLTVAAEGSGWLEACIIPHTRAVTNLAACRAGSRVNLEFEVIAKYIDRMLEKRFGGQAKGGQTDR
jgi:riboflavin synthase